jgi:hypothetical protein
MSVASSLDMIVRVDADEDGRDDLVCVGIEDNIAHAGLGIYLAIPM